MKNFFHDISDILLALVIVVIAAGVVFWRIQVIMEYPDKVAAENAANRPQQEAVIDTEVEEEAEESSDDAAAEEPAADMSEEEGEDSGEEAEG